MNKNGNEKVNSGDRAEKSKRGEKRSQVRRACSNCRRSKTACSDVRPCPRCVAHHLENCCVDAPMKRRRQMKSGGGNSSNSPSHSECNGGEACTDCKESSVFSSSDNSDDLYSPTSQDFQVQIGDIGEISNDELMRATALLVHEMEASETTLRNTFSAWGNEMLVLNNALNNNSNSNSIINNNNNNFNNNYNFHNNNNNNIIGFDTIPNSSSTLPFRNVGFCSEDSVFPFSSFSFQETAV